MTKEQKKKQKQIIQQQVSNVIKDNKGRPFFIDERTGKYYRLLNNEENSFYTYDARLLFSIVPIMIFELAKKDWMFYGLILSILINLGFEAYHQYLIKNMNPSNRVPDEVVNRYESVELLKEKRSDLLLKLLLGVVIAVMIFTNPHSYKYADASGIMKYVGNFVFVLAIGFALSPIFYFVKLQKAIKNKTSSSD